MTSPSEDRSSVWTEVSLRVDLAGLDPISDLLARVSGHGTVVEPAIEAFGPAEGYTLDTGAPHLVKGYFYGPVVASRRASLRRQIEATGLAGAVVGRMRWRELREEDWANAWKEYYSVQHAGRIAVRPAWLDYEPSGDEVVVSLDPGIAFGTGDHPTTRMCLEAMQTIDLEGKQVLDLGCGSGILSLAAVALGATHCLALDIEEMATTAARSNVALNAMEKVIAVEHRTVDSERDGPFDAIFANISAGAIASLAPAVARVARKGAPLLAGGIIEPRLQEACAALAEHGWSIDRVLESGDWRTILAHRL